MALLAAFALCCAAMNFFETFLRDLIIGGSIVAPIFIHSAQGVAILNASETGLAAILQAHAQTQATKTQAETAPAPAK